MGVYPEDSVIDVPELMRLWVAEGFLKPSSDKCLEVVAKEYFNDLVGRNLILVINETGYSEETIKCKVHDLLADICVREAQKHKFPFVVREHRFNNPQDLNTQRRIVVHDVVAHADRLLEVIHAILSHGTLVRSITCNCPNNLIPKPFNSRLLRVWNWFDIGALFPKIVNCRYISGIYSSNSTLPSSIFSLWNLQTLYVRNSRVVLATSGIWKMSQLRHVRCRLLNLMDPPPSGHTNDEGDDFVWGKLQTLMSVKNFKFSEDVVRRMPRFKELGVHYNYEGIVDWSSCCLDNLIHLINLESLDYETVSRNTSIFSELTFPHSLKELSLKGTKLRWGDLGTKIGSLSHLQFLKLRTDSVVGTEWETVEGQFLSLKYLSIGDLWDLKYWRTESCTHFPRLERLTLFLLPSLKEIPSEIGENLKSIEITFCSISAVVSAKEILNEQEGLGSEGLQVQVTVHKRKNTDVESLAAPNFQITTYDPI